jgi:hypothetical protein
LRWVRRGLTSGLYQLQQQVGWLGMPFYKHVDCVLSSSTHQCRLYLDW